MDKYTAKLLELRVLIPVGISDGYKLLDQTGGDVAEAVAILREQYIQHIMKHSLADRARATALADRYNYHMERILGILLDEIEEAYFTATEVIVRRCTHHPSYIVGRTAALIIETHSFLQDQWTKEVLEMLNPYQRCIVVVQEWMDDFKDGRHHSVLSECPAILSDQLEFLKWPELAEAYRFKTAAKAEAYKGTMGLEAYIKAGRKLWEDELYVAASQFIDQSEGELIARLSGLIIHNLDQFP